MLIFLFLGGTIFYHILWCHYHLSLLIVVPAFCEHGKINCSLPTECTDFNSVVKPYRFVWDAHVVLCLYL
jgi:hypothetical protein